MAARRAPPTSPDPPADTKRSRLFSRNQRMREKNQFAMVKPVPNARVTSAALRTLDDDPRGERMERARVAQNDRGWQEAAWEMTNLVGELGSLLTLQSNVVSMCEYRMRRQIDGQWVANDPDDEDVYDPRPAEVMDSFVGPNGEGGELIRLAAYNLFVAGDTSLVGTPMDDVGEDGILWEFLSISEFFLNTNLEYVRQEAPLANPQFYRDGELMVARLHRASAQYTALATSEVKAALPTLQRIVVLNEMIDSALKSRLPAQLWLVPDSMSFAGEHEQDDETGELEDDDVTSPLVKAIYEHIGGALDEGPTSKYRRFPMILQGEKEDLAAFRILDIGKELDAWLREMLADSYQQLAHQMHIPPEEMTGLGTSSHWNAAIINHDFVTKYIVPIANLIADFLSRAYLRQMLIEFEDMSPEEAAEWKLEADPSPVIARIDEAKSAQAIRDQLSDEALVTASGFSKADMVSEEQKFQRQVWQLVTTYPEQYGPLLSQLPGFDALPADLLAVVAEAMRESNEANGIVVPDVPLEPDIPDVASDEMPEMPADGTPQSGGAENLSVLVERLTVKADEVLKRGRERAANRFLSGLQKHPDVKERFRTTRKDRVLSLATADELTLAKLTPRSAFDGAFEDLFVTTRGWAFDHLVASGMDEREADARAAFAANALTETLRTDAEANLLRPAKQLRSDVVAGVLTQAFDMALVSS